MNDLCQSFTKLTVTPNLSDLLPYDISQKTKGNILNKNIKEFRLLLIGMQQATNALKAKEFEQFDALVGENACQIRAVKIAMTAQKYVDSVESLQAQINKAMQNIERVLQSAESMKKGGSMKDLLKSKTIDVALTSDELFLIESFLLSVAKSTSSTAEKSTKVLSPLCQKDVVDLEKLKQQFGQKDEDVSNKFVSNLVSKTRKLLSEASVLFVQEQAKLLKNQKLEDMCSGKFNITHNKYLSCSPMFWTYKTCLLAAQKQKIPLVLYAKFLAQDKGCSIIDEACIVFQPVDTLYEESSPYQRDLAKAAIIVQGIVYGKQLPSKSQWKETMRTQKLDVILAGAADHRQYPDQEKDRIVEELGDKEFELYKKMASEGYSLKNSSKFFIQHVYSSTLGSVPQLAEKAKLAEQFSSGWPQRVVTYIMSYMEDEGGTYESKNSK